MLLERRTGRLPELHLLNFESKANFWLLSHCAVRLDSAVRVSCNSLHSLDRMRWDELVKIFSASGAALTHLEQEQPTVVSLNLVRIKTQSSRAGWKIKPYIYQNSGGPSVHGRTVMEVRVRGSVNRLTTGVLLFAASLSSKRLSEPGRVPAIACSWKAGLSAERSLRSGTKYRPKSWPN